MCQKILLLLVLQSCYVMHITFHSNTTSYLSSSLPYFQDAIIDLCEDDDVNIRKQAIKV